jgi:hypothetical protein
MHPSVQKIKINKSINKTEKKFWDFKSCGQRTLLFHTALLCFSDFFLAQNIALLSIFLLAVPLL